MSSARIVGVASGADFGGVVDDAPIAARESAFRLRDDYLSALSDIFSSGVEGAVCQEAQELLVQRIALNKACAAFLERQVAKSREQRIEAHEEAKAACLAQQKKIEKLKRVIVGLKDEIIRLRDIAAKMRTAANEIEMDVQSISKYAPRAQIETAKRALESARAQAQQASEADAPIFEQIRFLEMNELARENQKLRELDQAALELNAIITGQPFTDSLGFAHGPRPPA